MNIHNLTTAQREKLQNNLIDAQYHLNEAIHYLTDYVRLSGDLEAETYIVDQLKIITTRDHGFLAGDLNLDDLLERLNDQDDEPEDDESDDEPCRYYSSETGRWVTVTAGN